MAPKLREHANSPTEMDVPPVYRLSTGPANGGSPPNRALAHREANSHGTVIDVTAIRRFPPPVFAVLALVLVALVAGRSEATDRWRWPLVGAVSHGFERPASAWGAGHRGIDIAAGVGAAVRSPVAGVVTFVGDVAGRGVVVISTPYDEDITLEPLEPAVIQGDLVETNDAIGFLRSGHDGGTALHFGVRLHGAYIDPLTLLPEQPRVVIYDSRLISW